MSPRLLFLGTPGIAVPSLEMVSRENDVGLVVTRPDRPRGRSGRPQPSEVKVAATGMGLRVAEPVTRQELTEVITSSGPFDVGVVVAFGMILPGDALLASARGMINAHFSLLPRWRGAAPVARALIAGDVMTGVTIIALDEGLDTGPVLTAQAVDIGEEETAGDVSDRLSVTAARLLAGTIPRYLSGELEPIAQSDEGATYAAKLEASDRPLRPDMGVLEAVNRVRGLSPRPGATVDLDGSPHRMLRARPHGQRLDPGTWEIVEGVPVFGFADGGLEVVELQAPGRKVTPGAAWARGRTMAAGRFV